MSYDIRKSENFKNWSLCNDILNAVRRAKGLEEVPKKRNPYKK